jgi:hypothetical protein
MTREVEHFFMYLLAICTSSFENSLLNSYAHFFIGMLILWELSFLATYKILDISCLLDEEDGKISHAHGLVESIL